MLSTKPRILILQPTGYNRDGTLFQTGGRWLMGMTVPYLAALCSSGSHRDDFEIECVDERITPVDPDKRYDLVFLTTFTHAARRAYQWADHYKSRGARVLMGGWHASFHPEETLRHVGSVCVGEAEPVIPQILKDAFNGGLKPLYRGTEFHDMKGLPFPRWDLMPMKRYRIRLVPMLTTRGCPFGCNFCEVTTVNGARVRFRPVEEVIAEVQYIRSLGENQIQFVDDNFAIDHRYTKELLKRLIPLKVKWSCLWTTKDCKDEELLRLAKEAGLWHINMGMESINKESLKTMHKYQNLIDYREVLARLNRMRIFYSLNFIFGWDTDTPRIFNDTYEFLVQNKVPMAFFSVLTPRRGTKIYYELESQKRIFDYDQTDSRDGKCTFHPKHMSARDLEDNVRRLYRRFYSFPSMSRRLFPIREGFGEILLSNLFFWQAALRGKSPLDYY